MILFVTYDKKNDLYSNPIVGPDFTTVQNSLNEMQPKNLNDLVLIPLDTFDHLSDLTRLRINHSIPIHPQVKSPSKDKKNEKKQRSKSKKVSRKTLKNS